MIRSFDHRWRIHTRLPERFGQPCRVTARGRLNSIRVEFEDGFWCITSRWAVRPVRNDTSTSRRLDGEHGESHDFSGARVRMREGHEL
jgi:hypothetical protein